MGSDNSISGVINCLLLVMALLVVIIATGLANHILIFKGGPFDIASILLIAATLVVTGVGVTVGIVAIWGYRDIKKRAIEAAKTEAHAVAERVAKEAAEPVAARTAQESVQSVIDQINALSGLVVESEPEPDTEAEAPE